MIPTLVTLFVLHRDISKDFFDKHFLLSFLLKGAFTIYVDQFSEILDPSLPIGRSFIYWGLFSKVDIWLTPSPYLLST